MRLHEYYKALSDTKKSVLWFTICNFLIRGISIITSPIATRLLPENEYGLLQIFVSYEQVFMILATWEVYSGSYQRGLFVYKDCTRVFTSITVFLSNIITICFFSIVLVFFKPITSFTGYTSIVILLLFLFLLVVPSYQCWLVRKRTKFEYKPAVFVTITYTLSSSVLSLIATYFFSKTAVFRYSTSIIICLIICLPFYYTDIKHLPSALKKGKLAEMLKYIIAFQGPLVLHALSYLVLSQSDRVMIGKICGNEQAAFYSIAYGLASIINIFQNALNQVLTPWRYQKMQEQDYPAISRTTTFLLIALGSINFVFIAFSPEIMRILYPSSYFEGVYSIPPISMGIFFMFLYSAFVNVEAYFKETKYITIVSVSCGLINILLNYIFINKFGYVAASYTTMVSYMLFAFGHYLFMKKVLREKLAKQKIFSLKMILIICLIFTILSLSMVFLFDIKTIRYLLVLIIVIISFSIFMRKRKYLILKN